MKIKLHLKFKTGLALFVMSSIIVTSCKKEYSATEGNTVNASDVSQIATDGKVTVQSGILPPATPQSFIPNGGTATVQYEFHTTIDMFIFSLILSATPDIYSVDNFYNIGYINAGPLFSMKAGSSYVWNAEVKYNNVDSATSGTISQLVLNRVNYQTPDGYIDGFDTKRLAVGPTFCLVNNIPHIQFRNPQNDTLKNGYTEIAEVKLTGDTQWVLKSLPLHFYQTSIRTIVGNVIVKYKKQTVKTTNDSIGFPNQFAQTTVNFGRGFKHTPGIAEVLKIYAKSPNPGMPGIIFTNMEPLNSFVWIDGLGKVIKGTLNAKYYKELTGESAFGHL